MVGIYKIQNKLNQKVYIGQSKNGNRRLNAHKNIAFNRGGNEYDRPLHRAIRKYGIDNFSFEFIEECCVEDLDKRERYWIQYYDSFISGYNLTFGGNSSANRENADKVISIIKELEETDLIQKDIAIKYNISEEMVQGINTGRYWYHNRMYPIRKSQKLKLFYCLDCGIEITRNSCRCRKCSDSYKVAQNILPISRESLKEMIRTEPFTKIGIRFGISDNAIRKWCVKYNLPSTKKDIKKYSEKEWLEV